MSIICMVEQNGIRALACPSGKQYRVALPICDRVPELRNRPLYAHKSFSAAANWVVTESTTGLTVGKGKTRKAAMTNAQERLLNVGNAGFVAIISDFDRLGLTVAAIAQNIH